MSIARSKTSLQSLFVRGSEWQSKTSLAAFFSLLALATQVLGQTGQPPKPPESDEIVRVYSELVQTDVMVFDKQGRFINNLRQENFELKIDGKVRPIQFFERITAGRDEEAQLAAARRSSAPETETHKVAVPLDRGRTVFFYIDDFHMALPGVVATQKLITKFLDDDMGQNDEVAVTSASGQIGFLDQLTDNKIVLRAALERIKSRGYNVRDLERPQMTEYQALLIDGYDRDLTDFFVDETLRLNPGIGRDIALAMVRGRAESMLAQAAVFTRNTLSGLESLIRSAGKLPGRKLVFFVSGGFFLDHRNSDSLDRLQQITSAAAHNGVVIYSMDARGLIASLADISDSPPFDLSGRLARANGGEVFASQDALNALARDTGGKPIFNTNDLNPGLVQALKETSVYYLLAWKPEQASQARFRKLEVSIRDRSDLVVRVRRGFFDLEPSLVANKKVEPNKALKTAETELSETLREQFPERRLPISLALSYLNSDQGPLLSASMQVSGEFLTFELDGEKNLALVDLLGAVYNSQGQVGARFNEHITIRAPADASNDKRSKVFYTYPVTLAPGLYQVRAAARDKRSGQAGSAQAWIEIPDLKNGQLALSSLIIGERAETATKAAVVQEPANAPSLSVDHLFRNTSYLRFLIFIYNATAIAPQSSPDLAVQLQVIRDDQPVMTTALKKVQTEGTSLANIPYAADIPLADFKPGRYLLQVNVIDRISKRSKSQLTRFEVY